MILIKQEKKKTTNREHQYFLEKFVKSTSLVPDYRSGQKVDQNSCIDLLLEFVRVFGYLAPCTLMVLKGVHNNLA